MMDFYELVDRVANLLQQRGKLTYRSLRRQFDLDDEALDDLKEELCYAHPVVDEDGRGLIWTGDVESPELNARHRTEDKRHFQSLLPAVMALLRQEGQVTHRAVKYIFSIDNTLLEEIREELIFRGLAIDKDGKGLVWTGDTQALETLEPADAISTDVQSEMPTDTPEPIHTVPEGERRQLTVMFCDLADSTKLSQQLDPEDLREVIRSYQATAATVINQFDGHIAQYLGDGLLIYFGWPVAHENDAQRSLHAGLGIVQAITATLNPRLAQEKGVTLTVRLGVHTGPVVVGEMGGDGRHENLATGETVNIAARLEGLAAPNTVIISSVTERLVRRAFEIEDLGPQVLKGAAEPMDVFRVTRPLHTERDDEEDLPGEGVFLVGRDEEVGLLLRRWEQSKEGLGQVVLISGEAGIGKSSLVAIVRHHVAQAGYTCMTFRCSPYHTNSALYPVISHLEQRLGFDRDDTPDTKLDKLEQVLRTTHLSLEASMPLLASLLSISLDERYAASTLSPQQQRQQTLDLLVAWLLEESEKHPLLAMWEDLHWADPSTLEMLGFVLEQTPTVPMLHVLTFRPQFTSPWPTRSHMIPITLNRLERPQVEALVTHLTDNMTLPEEVVEHIVTKTDGVPLYVEELTKMLLASDLLSREADQYVLTGPLSTVAIPDTLQDSLMARLDQMNSAKEVAQIGAVLGRAFTYEMLQAIATQDEETIQVSLAQLVEAELLYQRGRPPRSRYIFKHALIQDAAYASLLRSTRQHVHQQIAQLLEGQFPDIVASQPELVAHHYTEAGQTTDALRYWQQAGRHANQRSSLDEAIAHISKGLNLVRQLPATPARIEQELQMSVALGSSLMIAGKGWAAPEVEAVYSRARELCQQLGNTPQLFTVLAGMTAYYIIRGEHPTAREQAEECLTLAEREQRPIRLVWAHSLLGWVLYQQGELVPARQHLEDGMGLYNPRMHRAHLPTQDPGVNCLCQVSGTLSLLGYMDQALERAEMAHTLAQELDHPFSKLLAGRSATTVYMLRGDIQAAAKQAEEMIDLATEQGFNLLTVAQFTILQGWIWAMQGQFEEGLGQIRQGLESWQTTGAEHPRPFNLALLAEVYGRAHQPDAGLKAVTDALALIEQRGERYYESELHRLRGDLLLSQSTANAVEAETCFQQALDIARRQQAKSWELRTATSLARLWQSQGKRRDAYDLLALVYGWFTEGFDTADLQDARGLLQALR